MSNEIKNTISLLCKLLNTIYGTNLKAEHFRLAKFDKTEENVVSTLWNSIGKILNENCPTAIKNEFYNLKFKRKYFYQLNKDNNKGSRELLIALVFLVSLFIEKDLGQRIEASLIWKELENGPNEANSQINEHRNFNWKKLSNHELENYKKWLKDKILANSNKISLYTEQIGKIEDKYNKCLNIKAHRALTMYEILALKNKKIGQRFLEETSSIANIMQLYREWMKKEKLFWKWMDTVLEETKRQ